MHQWVNTASKRAQLPGPWPHCAQNADHRTHNHPFSAFFAEVVCTLSTTPLTLAHQTGDLHYMSVRHADDTQPEGFM